MNRWVLQITIAVYITGLCIIPLHSFAQGGAFVEVGPNTYNTIRQTVKDFSLDKLAQKLAANVLNRMVDSVIGWANNDFDGQPSFISNFDGFTEGIGVSSAGFFVQQFKEDAASLALKNASSEEIQFHNACNAAKARVAPLVAQHKQQLEINAQTEGLTYSLYMAGYLMSNGYVSEDKYFSDYARDQMTLDEIRFCELDPTITINRDRVNDIVKFVGTAYYLSNEDNRDRAAEIIGTTWIDPRYKNDFTAGGWETWDQLIDLRNTPWGSREIAKRRIEQQVEADIAKKVTELQRGSGFLDKGKCAPGKEKVMPDGTKYCTQFLVETPGDVVRNYINDVSTAPIRNAEGVKEWGDVLSGALSRLVVGMTNYGLAKLNSGIDSGINDLLNSKNSSVTGSQSNITSSNQYVTGSGNWNTADQVIDIEAFLYGEPRTEKDTNGSTVYEPLLDGAGDPLLDTNGNPIPDTTRPRYIYRKDTNGAIVYKRDGAGNLLLDANNQPIPIPEREMGAIEISQQLNVIFANQQSTIREELIPRILELDRAFPGPDFGWNTRLDKRALDKADQESKREIVEIVRSRMLEGTSGVKKDDPRDIALIELPVSNVTRPPNRVGNNPRGWHLDYRVYNPVAKSYDLSEVFPQTPPYPTQLQGVLNATNAYIQSNIAYVPITADSMSLDHSIQNQGYAIASLNTFAGTWKNPISGQEEIIGNIPSANEVKSFIDGSVKNYKDLYSTATRRISELNTVQSKLQSLEQQYQALPNVGPDSTDAVRNARQAGENEIARALSSIRETVPTKEELDNEKFNLAELRKDLRTQDLNNDGMPDGRIAYYKVKIKQELTGTVPGTPPYEADKYTSLYVKDRLGILYCPFQDHRIINAMSNADKLSILSKIDDANDDLNIKKVGLYTTSPLAMIGAGLFNNNNLSPEELLLYYAPIRCFQTSVICNPSADDKSCDNSGCNGGNGFSEGEAKREGYGIICKNIYRASLTDYHDAIIERTY